MEISKNKPGRKKKAESDLTISKEEKIKCEVFEVKHLKKRGRKPKGGKILDNQQITNNEKKIVPNIIIHLKCSMNDLKIKNCDIQSYNNNDLHFELIDDVTQQSKSFTNNNMNDNDNNITSSNTDTENIIKKNLNNKLKELEINLHLNDINCSDSACFWCSYEFENSPFYIPKHFIRNGYEVYGCFCSPECSCAYLMNEHIDETIKFERYHLLNNIYGKMQNYTQNIKPAHNPFYILDKYNGNLTIQEYRSLFKYNRSLIIVEKPLTKILPELHEDNEDFILNNKLIASNTFNIKRKNKRINKTDIINDTFGLA
jgi:hypothetical protein